MELKETILNRIGIAEAMGHRATETARRLQQAAHKHHDAANGEIADLAKQIEAKGVGQDEELENRYCRALVTRSHMIQAGHLAQIDAGKMPEVGGKLEKAQNRAKLEAAGQVGMNFEEDEHPRAEEGSAGQFKPGEFVPKEQRQEAAQAAEENGFPGLAEAHREEPVDPQEDWEKNGVRAQAFKNWFGDWENDPENASKVVDAETGEPTETWHTRMEKGKTQARPVFHGTGKGGFRSFRLEKTDPNGLVGPGFYFTENEDIARSYTAKEEPEKGLSRDLTDEDMAHIRAWAERNKQIYQVPSILTNMDKKERPDFQTWLAHREDFHAPLKQLGITSGVQGGAKVYSCYLNIRNPIDADEKLTDEQLRGLWEHWPEDHQWKIDTKKEMERDPHFDGGKEFMLDNRGRTLIEVMSRNDNYQTDWTHNNKAAIQKALAGMGYDGLTHIGGTYVGNGDTKHRVWVAWEPSQVKSSKESEGTFDPNSPDIYKAVRRPFVPPDMPKWRNGRPEGEDRYLPLNGVEDRAKVLHMVREMRGGRWKWHVPLIRCGDQLLTGSHRYAAAKITSTPLQVRDVDDLFREGGLDFKETWEAHAQPWDGWLSNMDYALKCLPQDLLDKYGVDLG